MSIRAKRDARLRAVFARRVKHLFFK